MLWNHCFTKEVNSEDTNMTGLPLRGKKSITTRSVVLRCWVTGRRLFKQLNPSSLKWPVFCVGQEICQSVHTLFFVHQWLIFVGIHMYHCTVCVYLLSVYIHLKLFIKHIWFETPFSFQHTAAGKTHFIKSIQVDDVPSLSPRPGGICKPPPGKLW